MKNDISIMELLGSEGPIAGAKAGYEYRDGQVTMASLVQTALDEDQICIIEAGTGIGKSFAYLIPLFIWCMDHPDDRTVIATSTIHLQHQLFEKDIPFLQEALHMPVRSSVLKGRNNYLCKRRMYKAIGQRSIFDAQDGDLLGRIMVWSNQTISGDRAELPFPVSGKLWSQICSDADTCMGFRCQHRDSCFLMEARKKALQSQIVIVNHHLLLADMILKQGEEDPDFSIILPPFSRLVIDEAHNIEKNATSYFTDVYDGRTLLSLLARLTHTRRGSIGGLLEELRVSSHDPLSFNAIYQQLNGFKLAIDAFDTAIETFIASRQGSQFIERDRFLSNRMITTACSDFHEQIRAYTAILRACLDSCEEMPEVASQFYEATAIRVKIESIGKLIGHYISFDLSETHVYWIDFWVSDMQIRHLSLKLTPVDFSSLLREGIFNVYHSIICTSATLTVQNRFDHWEQKVGIGDQIDRECIRQSILSPFDYRNRVLMCLPSDAPEPTSYREYMDYGSRLISELITTAEGGALVLFTSYAMLHEMYDLVCAQQTTQQLHMLKQGDQDRYRLMKQFVEDEHSVLFATQSFWEGIDAPGNTLRLLIVSRLPFSVPTEPIFYAKKLLLEKQGRNSFFELSLPDAIIKLKQGFGRLMRTSEDRGVVCILDSRILNKRYGKQVIASLPQTQLMTGTGERIVERVEDFLYAKQP
ncbi:MAG: hypothetical protein K9M84_02100 [Spirochaetia bacterium]|nr:hypothetical protein [Spirochaetia bacterium]